MRLDDRQGTERDSGAAVSGGPTDGAPDSLTIQSAPERAREWVLRTAEHYARRAVPSNYVRIMAADLPSRRRSTVAAAVPRPSVLSRWRRPKVDPPAAPEAVSRWTVETASTAGMAQGLAATCIDVVEDISESPAWTAHELDDQRVRIDLAAERFHVLSACADLDELRRMLGGEIDRRDDTGSAELLEDAVNERRAQYADAEWMVADRIATLRSYSLGLVQIDALLRNRNLALTLTRSVLDAEDLHDRIITANSRPDHHDRDRAVSIEMSELEVSLDGQLRFLAGLIAKPAGLPLHIERSTT